MSNHDGNYGAMVAIDTRHQPRRAAKQMNAVPAGFAAFRLWRQFFWPARARPAVLALEIWQGSRKPSAKAAS